VQCEDSEGGRGRETEGAFLGREEKVFNLLLADEKGVGVRLRIGGA